MKKGRPKSGPTTPPRKGRPSGSQTADAFDGVAKAVKANDPRKPRKTHKHSLAWAILADPNLSDEDKKAIVQAGKTGLSVGDLAMLVVYELRTAQRLFDAGKLEGKDFIVATNKIASQVAAGAQMAVTQDAGVPSRVNVAFTIDSGHVMDGARTDRPPPGPCGDVVEVE